MSDNTLKELLEHALNSGLSYEQMIELVDAQYNGEPREGVSRTELAGALAKAEERLKEIPIGEEIDFDDLIYGSHQS